MKKIHVGTAAWNIPKSFSHLFDVGTDPIFPILTRYAHVLNAVEVNSSFYREHQAKTYQRWAQEVPDDFKFSVKLWRAFTHEQKLNTVESHLKAWLRNIQGLGTKLHVLLIQLPPKLMFDFHVVKIFFDQVRANYCGLIAIEPRHTTWTQDERVFELFKQFNISKVFADPERCTIDEKNCGWENFKYYRLHGSPEIYKSDYTPAYLEKLAAQIRQSNAETWCIFDNTTFGHATNNAVTLRRMLG